MCLPTPPSWPEVKFTNSDKVVFFFFLMHADMTAVTIQSNNIALKEVKDKQLSPTRAILLKKHK